MTFEVIRIWIPIPIKVIKYLEICLSLENSAFFIHNLLIQFRVSNYNLLHLITLPMNKCCYCRNKNIWFLDDIWENLPLCIMAEFYWPQAIPCLCTHEKLSKVYWTRLYTLVRFSSKFKFQVWHLNLSTTLVKNDLWLVFM